MHQAALSQRRPSSRQAFQIDGGLHMHEGQGDKLREAPRLRLEGAQVQQVARPRPEAVQVPEHECAAGADAHIVRCSHHLQPRIHRKFVGTKHGTHIVIQNFRRCARQRTQASCLQLPQERFDGPAARCSALRNLQRAEGVHVDPGGSLPRRPQQPQVGVAGEVGVDAALHAHLPSPPVPGLRHAAAHLLQRQVVRLAPHLLGCLAFAEGAKLAGVRTHVGVIDVAIHGEGHPQSGNSLPEAVSGAADSLKIVTASR
mmetsp:Transcript_4715/g.13558  ORF Transcript_4715/g.13558 Transcript_4715/m.13558 type:complete len:257 (-) Transcript_4715:65-835(-)